MASNIIGDLIWRVRGDTSQFDQSMTSVDRKTASVNKTIAAAEGAALGLAAAYAVVAKQVFDTGKTFDQSLGNVATLLSGTGNNIEDLKDDVKDLSVDTGLSLGDLTDGLYQTVSAFGDTSEATEQLGLAAQAARAGVASVTDSINLASAVTKAYGDTSAEAQEKAFDLAFQTVKLGQTTFPELAASIQKVTDGSVRLGVSQEELFASFATLTGVTGGAAEVSTQLRAALVALDKPTTDLAKLYDKLGVSSGAALIEQEGLQGALTLIAEESERTGIPLADYLSSVEAVTAASNLAGSQSDTFRAKLEEMGQAAGATEAAFNAQNETLNGTGAAYDRLNQSVEVLKTTLFDFYSEDLANTFNGLTVIVEAVGNLNDKVQEGQERLGAFSDILSLAVPTKAIAEYNSQFFRLIGSIGDRNEAEEESLKYQEAGLGYLTSRVMAQEEITAEIEARAEAQQKETEELQRLIDLENQRVSKVIEDRGLIEAAYNDEVRFIENKNALGLLSEEEYINQRLEAEQQLVDDLIQIGYDGQALKDEQLQIGDQLILDSLERQKLFAEEAAKSDLEIKTESLDKFAEYHDKTMTKAIAQQGKLSEQTIKNREAFADLASTGIGALSSGFAQIGADLVNQELSWKSFANLALEAVAAVLEGVGARLAGDAALLVAEAILFGNPALAAGAGPALLASGAAYGAAGALRAASGSFESGGIVPGPPSPTDNRLAMVRSGEEIIPEEDPRHSSNGGTSELTINLILDGDAIASTIIEDYVNTGQYTVTARGLR